MSSQKRQTTQSNALSSKGMVSSSHWLATEAGVAVLQRGGNAIEALIAAGAVLSVVYPHFCGLGGDAVWIISDEKGRARTFMGIGQAAEVAELKQEIPLRGPGSLLTTACLVDSWEKVLNYSSKEWAGSERLSGLLEDAIVLAEDGFAVSKSQSFWFDFRDGESGTWPGFQEYFRREGIQHQPRLARTLQAIAKHGTREFYEGSLARQIAIGLADVGSPLTELDLKKAQTLEAAPVGQSYRDTVLLAPPPPTQGLSTLGIMGVLNHLPMADKPIESAAFYHALVEGVKQAFLDRSQIADPAYEEDVSAKLLDPSRLAAKAASIHEGCAMPWPHLHQTGDTAFLGAVDSHGRCASLLQSIYFDWGSGMLVGDTGILWQNRGAAFSTDPASPNCFKPGKRPFYTLNPGLALKAGRPYLVYGTQGADGQPQTLALLLSLVIDHGLDPRRALSRPRYLLGRTFSDSRDSLKLEAGLDESTFDALAALGHEISRIDAFSPIGGQAGIIQISEDGQMLGAHDPRSDGGAIGL